MVWATALSSVVVVQVLETRVRDPQFGLLEATRELAVVAREMFGVDEHPDAFVEGERPDRRILQLRAIGVGHRAEPEGAETVESRFSQHGRSPSGSDGS